MKYLFTGKGGAGSWECRGVQLGAALASPVKANATLADCKAADVIVVVKRTPFELMDAIRRSGRPWVWDIVDAYPQPASSTWTQREAINWARKQIDILRPDAVIWPCQKMQDDCSRGGHPPGATLYHHHRPGIELNPIREDVKLVAYEGAPAYLEGWRHGIERECEKRGWSFTLNPQRLADVDIVLAVRGGQWAGYPSTHWKSNVKLANAHGSGTPFVGKTESAYTETAAGAEYWADDPAGLGVCFDWLRSQAAREAVRDRFLQKAYTVEQAADDLGLFLRAL